jgi:hypothetical protein
MSVDWQVLLELASECEQASEQCIIVLDTCTVTLNPCYALLRMRHLSIACAEGFVVISCGKVDYDKSS